MHSSSVPVLCGATSEIHYLSQENILDVAEKLTQWKPRELVVAVTVVITTVTVKSRYFDNGYCDKANTIAYCNNGLL